MCTGKDALARLAAVHTSLSLSIKRQNWHTDHFSCTKTVIVGGFVLFALVKIRKKTRETLLIGQCYTEWPHGKTKGLICGFVLVCTLRDACVHLPQGITVQWVKGDDAAIWRFRELSTAVEAVMRLCSPRLLVTYYHTRADRVEASGLVT